MTNKDLKYSSNLIVNICNQENISICEALNNIFKNDINKDINITQEFIYDRIFEYGFKKNII